MTYRESSRKIGKFAIWEAEINHYRKRQHVWIFLKKTISKDETVHTASHETIVCIFRRAGDWLAAEVEGGIKEDRNAGEPAELLKQIIKARIVFLPERLYTGRAIHVGAGRYAVSPYLVVRSI
jgi:hypothetical protein